tara:strand:+ start:122 stop:526 length:405 start_codon:yes stop_codon:yes gene_type:complete
MIATARIALGRGYFETDYDDSLVHRLKWRRCPIWFLVFLVLFGVVIALAFTRQWLVGALFVAAGVYEFATAATHRRRWINASFATMHEDKTVCIAFHDTKMTTESPLGSSTMLYCGIERILPRSRYWRVDLRPP